MRFKARRRSDHEWRGYAGQVLRCKLHAMDGSGSSLEWQQLAERYRNMGDGELERVAREAWQLTDVARDTLRAEITNRGLAISLQQAAPPEDFNADEEHAAWDLAPEELEADLELQVLTTVWEREEAIRIEHALEDAGIAHFFGSQNVPDAEDVTGSFAKGIDIKVRYIDYQRGAVVMRQLAAGSKDGREPEDDSHSPVVCPKCKSEAVVLENVSQAEDSNTYLNSTYTWVCEDCGHEWSDDGVVERS